MRLINRIIPYTPAKKKSAPRPATTAILGSERGVALVMALILGLIGMLMLASLLYMSTTGIGTSGSKKRYQMALEAAHGGTDFFAKEIIQRGVGGDTLSAMGDYNGLLTQKNIDANFTAKLTTTGAYPASPADATLTLTFAAPNPNLTVKTAILSTSVGNSGVSSNVLVGGGVVNNSSGTVTPQHFPYMFQTEIEAQSVSGTQEKATLSAIYAY